MRQRVRAGRRRRLLLVRCNQSLEQTGRASDGSHPAPACPIGPGKAPHSGKHCSGRRAANGRTGSDPALILAGTTMNVQVYAAPKIRQIRSKPRGIEVTVPFFCPPERIPARICLSDITMPTLRKIPSYITGLSGFSVERNLHLAAQYAAARTLEMVVIDLLVGYTQPLSMHFRSLERIQSHDVLSLCRASRALIEALAAYWKAWIVEDEGAQAEACYDWRRPADFIARRPDFIPHLLQQDAFAHLHLLTHPVMTPFTISR